MKVAQGISLVIVIGDSCDSHRLTGDFQVKVTGDSRRRFPSEKSLVNSRERLPQMKIITRLSKISLEADGGTNGSTENDTLCGHRARRRRGMQVKLRFHGC